MSELIKRQDAIDAVSRQYRYGSDRMTALQNVAVVTEQEIRAKAIEEFAERLKERLVGMQIAELQGEDVCPCRETGEECKYMNQDIGCQYCAREKTIKDIDEIAEEMRGAE